MNVVERWKRIRELLEEKDYITVEELMDELTASAATIRRDLKAMEESDLLQRFRGGAQPVKRDYYNAYSIDKRMMENKEIKREICKEAAKHIQDGDYIYIDASSTTYFLIDYITAKDVTVITNAILLLEPLLRKKINTYVLNGAIDDDSSSILGEDTNSRIQSLNFNKAFIGSYGIDESRGFTTYSTYEGEFKKNIIEQSKKTFVLADSTKFSYSAFYTFGSLEQAVIITDKVPEDVQIHTEIIEVL